MSPRLVETPLASLAAPTIPVGSPAGTTYPRDRHDHSWALRAVTHEDGVAFEEFGCSGCGESTFR